MPEINITEEGKKLFDVEIAAMEAVKNALDERFEKIVRLICDAKKSSDIGFVSCGTG